MNNNFKKSDSHYSIWIMPSIVYIIFSLYCFRFLQDDTYINFIAGMNLIENGVLSSSLLDKVNPTTSNLHLLLSALIYSLAGELLSI